MRLTQQYFYMEELVPTENSKTYGVTIPEKRPGKNVNSTVTSHHHYADKDSQTFRIMLLSTSPLDVLALKKVLVQMIYTFTTL